MAWPRLCWSCKGACIRQIAFWPAPTYCLAFYSCSLTCRHDLASLRERRRLWLFVLFFVSLERWSRRILTEPGLLYCVCIWARAAERRANARLGNEDSMSFDGCTLCLQKLRCYLSTGTRNE